MCLVVDVSIDRKKQPKISTRSIGKKDVVGNSNIIS